MEATLVHMAWIGEGVKGGIYVDLDFADVTNIKDEEMEQLKQMYRDTTGDL